MTTEREEVVEMETETSEVQLDDSESQAVSSEIQVAASEVLVETCEEPSEMEAVATEVEAGEDQEIHEMITHTLDGEPAYFIVNAGSETQEGVQVELIGEPIPAAEIEVTKDPTTLERLTGVRQNNMNMQIVIEPSSDGGAPTARLVSVDKGSSSGKPTGTKIKVLSKRTIDRQREALPVSEDTLAGINTSEVSIQWKPSSSADKTGKPSIDESITPGDSISSKPEVEIKWRPSTKDNSESSSSKKSKHDLDKLQLLKDLNSSDESIELDSDIDDLGSLNGDEEDDDDLLSDLEDDLDFKKEFMSEEENVNTKATSVKEINLSKLFKAEVINKTILDIGNKENNEEEYGKPYVVLAPPIGEPITCYVSKHRGKKNEFVATANQLLPPEVIINSITGSSVSQNLISNYPQSKDLELKILELKKELEQAKQKLGVQRIQRFSADFYKEQLAQKTKKLKTLYTARRRLTKSLQVCKSELSNTQKALQIVESKAVLWNDTILSDLGKLIFKLHAGKNKRVLFDHRIMASRMPPEVKGFVISLFMTSQKAYQLVRNCFNGLPPSTTVTKWIHGERVVDGTPKAKKPRVSTNEVLLDDTFKRVINHSDSSGPIIVQYAAKNDQEMEMESQEASNHVVIETINEGEQYQENGEQVIMSEAGDDVEMITPEPGTIYYVLDEKGNVTGQLSEPPPDIIFTSEVVGTVEGYQVQEESSENEPQHEIVIGS